MMHDPPWPSARLGEVAQIQTGLAKGKQPEEGKGIPVPYLRVANVQDGYVDLTELKTVIVEPQALHRYSLQDGDVLFTEGGDADKLGRGCVWKAQVKPCLHQNHVFAVRASRNVLLPSFLAAYAAGPIGKNYFLNCAKQTTNLASINSTQLRNFPVPVPPLGEQRKIATILSSVDDAVEGTQAVIDQLQVVKKAMMAELLTRGLPGRHTRFKKTEIGELPENWTVTPCGDLFDVQLGKMMSAEARQGKDQLPYLRNENVHWLRFDLSDVATMHFDTRERVKFLLRTGDLLACEGRHIGRCALWSGDLDECYYQKALHRLRARSGALTTEYMQFFMLLRFGHMKDLVAEANATSTIPHLPREKLLALPVWYPPREEQDEIVSALRSLKERQDSEELALNAYRSLKSALLSALLTGEIRVTPDPDEAAP
ncbi:restriction endonuclease subunit S [Sorangium sp. So ce1014]|uniref:restriction endonuclease subunit S n=1 Tax=Sorangium sp. So ce1014 TaxID=3133326 RepID=UPI003F5F0183